MSVSPTTWGGERMYLAWAVSAALLMLYHIGKAIYFITFHPLARYPGPLNWRISRLPWMRSCWSGRLHKDVRAIHQKYGRVVRIAPDELSFADPAAWEDIYSNHGRAAAFPKSAIWHSPTPGRTAMLTNALNMRHHARVRKHLEPSFTERALVEQEDIVQHHVNHLIKKLRAKCAAAYEKTAVVDIPMWFTFVLLDNISDMALGEPFDLLDTGRMNEWAGLVFSSFKTMNYVASLRNYTWIAWLLPMLTPKSAQDNADYLFDYVNERVDRRMKQNTARPDFISMWQRAGKDGEHLRREEIQANAFLMTIAGSETAATTLSGAVYRLVRNPKKLSLLNKEVRGAFEREVEITFSSVKELTYLDAVTWETMRMCSALPVGPVRASPPEGGVVCGQPVPGKIVLTIHNHTVLFDPEFWHDPDSFCPERYLPAALDDPESPFHGDNRSINQPFSIGPRSCIGRPLALATIKLIIAKLVWAFDLEEVDTEAGRMVWEDQKVYSTVERSAFDVRLVPRR